MSQPPATTADLEALWRPLDAQEILAATALLESGWAVLQTEVPTVATISLDSVGHAVLRHVLVSAVLRVLRNPDGYKSESIDDYSFTRDSSGSDGQLYFTEAELGLVGGHRFVSAASVSMDSW